MSEEEIGYIAPFCEGAEQYCHSFMQDGVVGCEDCEYYRGYRYRKKKEGVIKNDN